MKYFVCSSIGRYLKQDQFHRRLEIELEDRILLQVPLASESLNQ